MHTTITLPSTADVMLDEEEPCPEGMYGPPRWLEDRGISSLLAPYLCDGWDLGDYARFAELSGTDARRLASLLPKDARNDRQNNAPRIIDRLRHSRATTRRTRQHRHRTRSGICDHRSHRISHRRGAVSELPALADSRLGTWPWRGRDPAGRNACAHSRRISHAMVVGMVGLINYPRKHDPTRVQLGFHTLHLAFQPGGCTPPGSGSNFLGRTIRPDAWTHARHSGLPRSDALPHANGWRRRGPPDPG